MRVRSELMPGAMFEGLRPLCRERSPSTIGSALDTSNLAAFDADAGHKALLIEDEAVNIILRRRGGEILATPSFTITTVGPTPISHPLLVLK